MELRNPHTDTVRIRLGRIPEPIEDRPDRQGAGETLSCRMRRTTRSARMRRRDCSVRASVRKKNASDPQDYYT
eukprot:95544-Rhodomonas_salina.1